MNQTLGRKLGFSAVIITLVVLFLMAYIKNLSDFFMMLLMFAIFGMVGLAVSKVLTSELRTRHEITPLLVSLLLMAASLYLLGEFILYLSGKAGMESLFEVMVMFLGILAVIGILFLKEEKTSNTILLATLLGIVSIGLYARGIEFPLMYILSFAVAYVVIYRLWILLKPGAESRSRRVYAIVTANSVLAFAGIILYRMGFTVALTSFVLIPVSLLLLWTIWSLLR